MIQVLWLDDQPDMRYEFAESLRADGLDVSVVWTEEAAIQRLERGPLPDVLVQDIYRPESTAQVSFLPSRSAPPPKRNTSWFSSDPQPDPRADSGAAGWRFYREVLVPAFPQLPVVIASVSADWPESRQTAEDFNLKILPKGKGLRERLVATIRDIVGSRRMVLAARAVPAIIGVDFERINSMLVRHLAANPLDLDRISWPGFEELIAVLLKELGYEVRRTPLTRDGGVDLWALQRSDLGDTLYAIDAKKYSRSRVIGPEPIRAIYGVADLENASVGMIVTTATFGPAAQHLAAQHRYRVALKDFDDVVGWIKRVGSNR